MKYYFRIISSFDGKTVAYDSSTEEDVYDKEETAIQKGLEKAAELKLELTRHHIKIFPITETEADADHLDYVTDGTWDD